MITRAKVIKNLDNGLGYKWAVNIPILNGVPNNLEEFNIYKEALNTSIENNKQLPLDQQKSQSEIATVIGQSWGDNNGNEIYSFTGEWDDNGDDTIEGSFNNKLSQFVMEAHVCGIPGIKSHIKVGDTVYVGFEDNDMGKPIILGHLLTHYIEGARSNYPSTTLESLDVKNSLKIPTNTVIGDNLSLSTLLEALTFYNSLISIFPGGSMISLLQRLNSLLPSQEAQEEPQE